MYATNALPRAAADVVLLLAVVFSLPFVILAVGIPIAALVQLLLWAGRQF